MRALVSLERNKRLNANKSPDRETATPWLMVRELRSRSEILDYFRVRHDVYVDTGYIPAPRPQGLDIDYYDTHSRFLGAFDMGKAGCPLIGGARMIMAQGEPNRDVVERLASTFAIELQERPHTFLVQNAFDLGSLLDFCNSAGKIVAEFGRTVCLPEYRNTRVGANLVYGLEGLGLQHKVDHVVAIGPPNLRRYYENFGCRHVDRFGIGGVSKYNAKLEFLLLDLPSLIGSNRSAHQVAGQLKRYDRILLCSDKRCLEWHNHHPKFQAEAFLDDAVVGTVSSSRQSSLEARLNLLSTDFQLHDLTLGEELHSASVRTPSLSEKFEILQAAAAAGVGSADLGRPGASPRSLLECSELLAAVAKARLGLTPTLSAHLQLEEIDALIEAGQSAGLAPHAAVVVGASAIRRCCDNRDLAELKASLKQVLARALSEGLEVMVVAQDASRTHPEALQELFRTAVDGGARRFCLCDSSGYATPAGVKKLVRFARAMMEQSGAQIKLDWHGCEDRGLSLVNSLAAIEAGVHRVHAAALGLGERVGSTSLEELILALHQRGARNVATEALRTYLDRVSKATLRTLPYRVEQSLLRLEDALPLSLVKGGQL